VTLVLSVRATARNLYSQIVTSFVDSDISLFRNMNAVISAANLDGTMNEKNTRTSHFAFILQGGSNMTGTDLYVNKPHCAAAVRP